MTEKNRQWLNRRYREIVKPTYDAFIARYDFGLDDLDGEVWKEIAGYDYCVSNFGRVKSLRGRWGKAQILKPHTSYAGYLLVSFRKDGKYKHFTVHRLVAAAFIPNSEKLPDVDHINGDKFDNRVDNLRWCTKAQNVRYSFDNGRPAVCGEEHYNSKLTAAQIVQIRESNLLQKELADIYGVERTVISNIQRGKRWKSAGGSVRQSKRRHVPDSLKAEILAEWNAGGISKRALAKKHGVGYGTVWNLISAP